MPVVFYKSMGASTELCVWKTIESESDLMQGLELSSEDETLVNSQRLAKRRIEKAACRQALAFLLGTKRIVITYDAYGAPRLKDCYVSFSHTDGYVAVAVSKEGRVGIDIEPVTPRINPLVEKFMNPVELKETSPDDTRLFHYFWGGKESVLKLYGRADIDFCENILLTPPSEEGGIGQLLLGDTRYGVRLCHWMIGGCMLVFSRFQK